jgi:hypothetical protein
MEFTTSSEKEVRELAQRASDGIEVRLLWPQGSDRVLVSVVDSRALEAFELELDGRQALDAFHHPFAYAAITSTKEQQ